MIEFGNSLRTAREAKGLTIAQLAETTKMLPAVIENLENEDFTRIAAPIYGRGFVKLYCEAVGLEAKPFVDEFMEILNGNRQPAIRERPVAHAEPPPKSEPIPVSPVGEPPAPSPSRPSIPEPDLFSPTPAEPPAPTAAEPPAPTAFEPPAAAAPAFESSQTDTSHDLSRYAAPLHHTHDVLRQNPSIWRLGLLAMTALALLVLLGFGIRSLYRATTGNPSGEPVPPETATSAEPASAVTDAPAPLQPAARRTPQSIPPIYID